MGNAGISKYSSKSARVISGSVKNAIPFPFDAMSAHTAVVFTRYMMLSIENRESNDNRSLGELFLYFTDEMSDITWIEAFQMLLQMFRKLLEEHCDLVDEKIDELVEAFISTLPSLLQSQLVAA